MNKISYLLSVGNLRNQDLSKYFMKDATCIFVDGCIDKNAKLKFRLAVGPCQPKHSLHERSQPTLLQVTGEQDSKCGYVDHLVLLMYEKILSQLQRFPVHNSGFLESLQMSVHFGEFYAVNVSRFLEGDQGIISIKDLEAAMMVNRKNRVRAERHIWRKNQNMCSSKQATEENKNKFKMKAISGGKQRGESAYCMNKVKRRTPKSLCCAFIPTVVSLHPLPPSATKNVEQSITHILNSSGFIEIDASSLNDKLGMFLISVHASKSFTLQVRLDVNFKLISISEKPLNWVHATILSGVEKDSASDSSGILHQHDIRVKVETLEEVPQNNELYAIVFPEGSQYPPIQYAQQSQRIIPAEKLSSAVQQQIAYVRKTTMRRSFKFQDACFGMTIHANLHSGTEYSGKDLIDARHFFNLSLDLDTEILKRWLMTRSGIADFQKMVDISLRKILEISNKLKCFRQEP
mmetsp:Transcript_34966/g.46202  ORF Transcript_34966/g.46202 Transcript_34966/m.46202 type:complete len:461 (-) Transcript_34966:218-1600(-)